MRFLDNAIKSTTWGPIHSPMWLFTKFSIHTRSLSPIAWVSWHVDGLRCPSAVRIPEEIILEQIYLLEISARRNLSCFVVRWSGGEIERLGYSPRPKTEVESTSGPSVSFIALTEQAKARRLSIPGCYLFRFRNVLRSGVWYRSPSPKLLWASTSFLYTSTSEVTAIWMMGSPNCEH